MPDDKIANNHNNFCFIGKFPQDRDDSGSNAASTSQKRIPVPPYKPSTQLPLASQTVKVVETTPKLMSSVSTKPKLLAYICIQEIQQKVFDAAENNDWNTVKETFDFLTLNELEHEQYGHLIHMAAAQSGSGDALASLAKNKELINKPDNKGRTPLLIAVMNNRSNNIINILLSAGAIPTHQDNDGKNILHLTPHGKNTCAFNWLSEQYPELALAWKKYDNTPQQTAVRRGFITWAEAGRRFGGGTPLPTTAEPARKIRGQPTPLLKQPEQPEPPPPGRQTLSTRAKHSSSQKVQCSASMERHTQRQEQVDDFHERIKNCALVNDRVNIRTLYNERPVSKFLTRYGNYDHMVFVALMDDDERLKRLMRIYPEDYKADLHLWDENKEGAKKFTMDDHLIVTNKTLTPKSKLVIMGHGPKLGNMHGSEFADHLDQWLSKINCIRSQTPRITLHSCRTAAGKDSNQTSFAEELVKRLKILGRETEISATTANIRLCPDGQDLCAKMTKKDGFHVVEYWQGGDVWLETDRQKKYNYKEMSCQNRRTDLIKVITATISLTTTVKDKHDIQGTQGMHSLIPTINLNSRKKHDHSPFQK